MNTNELNRIDTKCDRIILLLEALLDTETDHLIHRIRHCAEDIQRTSLIERRRNGISTISIADKSHD